MLSRSSMFLQNYHDLVSTGADRSCLTRFLWLVHGPSHDTCPLLGLLEDTGRRIQMQELRMAGSDQGLADNYDDH